LLGHSATEADDPEHAVAGDAVVAAVAKVERGPIENTLTIAGEFKPFQDVDVRAKVAGYIKKIYVDVGDHVKGGQTLAILEVPELAAQLVAQQEVDDTEAKDLETQAQVSSTQAALSAAQRQLEMADPNQKQFGAMSNYTRIVAPGSDGEGHRDVVGTIVDCNQMFFLTEESSPHAYITY